LETNGLPKPWPASDARATHARIGTALSRLLIKVLKHFSCLTSVINSYLKRRVALKTTEKTPDSSRANCKVIWRLTATSAWINCWAVVSTSVA